MAITDKEQGVWELDEVYNKINEGDIWVYGAPGDPGGYWFWGGNSNGSAGINVGDSPGKHRSSPTQIGTDTTWKRVQMAPTSIGMKIDGTLWAWGAGREGELGNNESGPSYYRSSPVQVGTDTTWAYSAGSSQVTLATKTDGTLWVWGDNSNGGYLGLNEGESTQKSSPTQIPGTNWNTNDGGIILGNSDGPWILATRADGTLWQWGSNGDYVGGHGQPSQGSHSSPTQIGTDTTWGTTNGTLGTCGKSSAFAIKTDGTLWSWGNGDDGVLAQGNNTRYSSPRQVGTDTTWSYLSQGRGYQTDCMYAIKTDGTLWSWGSNQYGRLGHNQATTNYNSPKQIGTATTWSQVAHGGNNTVATKTDGTLWTWGWNWYGMQLQLPTGSTYPGYLSLSSPTQVGSDTGWKEPTSGGVSGIAAIKQPSS